MEITALASYPKSGNTWVRFLLHHYLFGELPNSAALSRRIPDIHQGEVERAEPQNGRLIVKTHFPLSPMVPRLGEMTGVIYVVRHPKDVLLSMLNYLRLGPTATKWSDRDYAMAFINSGGDPVHQSMCGTWEQNVISWSIQRRIPLCFVRYNDLKRDTGACLREILTFLNEPIDDDRVARAVDASSFEQMRAMEVREKSSGAGGTVFNGTPDAMRRGKLFMNRGESGQSLKGIGADIDAAFDRRFGSAMWLLGYGSTALSSA